MTTLSEFSVRTGWQTDRINITQVIISKSGILM